MLRNILAILGGYFTLGVLVAVLLTAAYFTMGIEGVFEEGTYEVTTGWLVTTFALGLVAAVIGGLVCAFIARRGSSAPIGLAVLVIVLGIATAAKQLTGTTEDQPQTRSSDVTDFDAMMNGKEPAIALLVNPVIGVGGVLIGARLTKRGQAAQANPEAADH